MRHDFDFLPMGGPAWMPGLVGPDGRLIAFCKGAKAPDAPPPPPATPQVDESSAALMEKQAQKRKKGMAMSREGTLLDSLGGADSLGSQKFQMGTPSPKPKMPFMGNTGGKWGEVIRAGIAQGEA